MYPGVYQEHFLTWAAAGFLCNLFFLNMAIITCKFPWHCNGFLAIDGNSQVTNIGFTLGSQAAILSIMSSTLISMVLICTSKQLWGFLDSSTETYSWKTRQEGEPARDRIFNGRLRKLEYEKLGKYHRADYKFETAAAGLHMLNWLMLCRWKWATQRGNKYGFYKVWRSYS